MQFSETGMDTLKTPDGLSLDIHRWDPKKPKAVILAIHGGLAFAGDYVTPALYFMKKGIATAAYDLRGHKQKKVHIQSFTQFLDDTALFLEWVKGAYKKLPVIVMGHSMGGLIAANFGIRYAAGEERIKGYVLSSPYYGNKVAVPGIMLAMVGVISTLLPRMTIPMEDFTGVLTHDPEIAKRRKKDQAEGLQAMQASARFGNELLNAQKWVAGNIARWNKPVFAVVAGDDRLADPAVSDTLLHKLRPELLTYMFCKDNYHENLNELNREEIFAKIHGWMKKLLKI